MTTKASERFQRRAADGLFLRDGCCCAASLPGSDLACICKGCSVAGCGGRAPQQCGYVVEGRRCDRAVCRRHGGWGAEKLCPAHLVKVLLVETGGKPILASGRMRQVRSHRGLSQVHLAKLSGKARRTVERFEQGLVGKPPARVAIARALGLETVDPAQLWGQP